MCVIKYALLRSSDLSSVLTGISSPVPSERQRILAYALTRSGPPAPVTAKAPLHASISTAQPVADHESAAKDGDVDVAEADHADTDVAADEVTLAET